MVTSGVLGGSDDTELWHVSITSDEIGNAAMNNKKINVKLFGD